MKMKKATLLLVIFIFLFNFILIAGYFKYFLIPQLSIAIEDTIISFATSPANNADLAPQFPKPKGIKIGDKTYPMHNSLSLIDRVSRTIRDMAYNLGYQIIFPELMLKIIYIYNHSPHNTLSKLLNRRISPIEIYQNKNLQNIIIQKLNNQSKKIFHQNKFLIPENTLVNVYNEKNHLIKRRTVIRPDLYKIININGTMYKLQNVKNNEEIILPRYKIKY